MTPRYVPLDADLLRAVIANPGDNEVRLVAADWYDEHVAPERARFIRLQIEWASPITIAYDKQRLKDEYIGCFRVLAFPFLRFELSPVIYQAVCTLDWGDPTPSMGARVLYQRGFAEAAWLFWKEWEQYGPRLLEAAPIVEVHLRDAPERIDDEVLFNEKEWTFRFVKHPNVTFYPAEGREIHFANDRIYFHR